MSRIPGSSPHSLISLTLTLTPTSNPLSLFFYSVAKRAPVTRRATIVVRSVHQQSQPFISRRDASVAAFVALASLAASPSPALAFLGLGDGGNERYTTETGSLISSMTNALEMDASDPTREDAMGKVRKASVEWVSRYRRDQKFAGRPSYSNLYSAVNALDGQLNSFGLSSNVPKKRLERMQKELVDAQRQLERGR